MSRADERSWNEILGTAIEKINKRSRSFKISLDGQRYRSYLTVTLLKGNEWDDLCNEVWASTESDNLRTITDPAVESPKRELFTTLNPGSRVNESPRWMNHCSDFEFQRFRRVSKYRPIPQSSILGQCRKLFRRPIGQKRGI
jgi:hypothetical protein